MLSRWTRMDRAHSKETLEFPSNKIKRCSYYASCFVSLDFQDNNLFLIS